MRSLREKITFILTVTVYLLLHLRIGEDIISSVYGTFYQVLLTAPYAVGFTYITVFLFKKLTGEKRLPWDRYVRIFCTIGILFAFFFALYEYAQRSQPEIQPEKKPANAHFSSAQVAPSSVNILSKLKTNQRSTIVSFL